VIYPFQHPSSRPVLDHNFLGSKYKSYFHSKFPSNHEKDQKVEKDDGWEKPKINPLYQTKIRSRDSELESQSNEKTFEDDLGLTVI
jgi:hypothetical protein